SGLLFLADLGDDVGELLALLVELLAPLLERPNAAPQRVAQEGARRLRYLWPVFVEQDPGRDTGGEREDETHERHGNGLLGSGLLAPRGRRALIAVEETEHFLDLLLLLLARIAAHRAAHAGAQVRLENIPLYPADRCVGRARLREDIDAVAPLLDHLPDP